MTAVRPGRLRLGRALAPLGHELIEFGAVLGEAQPPEEVLELALLVFEALQRLRSIVVEGAVAAGRRTEPIAAAPDTLHSSAHHFHFFLQARHLALPPVATVLAVGHRRSQA